MASSGRRRRLLPCLEPEVIPSLYILPSFLLFLTTLPSFSLFRSLLRRVHVFSDTQERSTGYILVQSETAMWTKMGLAWATAILFILNTTLQRFRN